METTGTEKIIDRSKERAKEGQHPQVNFLQSVGEMFGSVDTSGLCSLIVLKSDEPEKQKAINAMLEAERP